MRHTLPPILLACVVSAAASAQSPCPADWNGPLGVPGTDGSIVAFKVWDPDGAGPRQPLLVVVGSFRTVGNTLASNVALWDGVAFESIGAGVNGYVSSVEVDRNNNLFVAGRFSASAGNALHNIASWDGAAWRSLAGGTQDLVNTLLLDTDGSLLIGGYFTLVDGRPMNHIARWTDAAWQPLGPGVIGEVKSMARGPGGVTVVTNDTSSTYRRLFTWNGSQWTDNTTAIASQINSIVTLANGNAALSGAFGTLGSVVEWNGTSFSSLGLFSGNTAIPLAVLPDGLLYVLNIASGFDAASNPLAGVARRVGTQWQQFAPFNYTSNTAQLYQGKVVIGGNFGQYDGDRRIPGFATQSASGWVAPPVGVDFNDVRAAIELPDHSVVVGGYFNTIGGVSANCVAKRTPSGFQALGTGIGGYIVRCLAVLPDGSVVAAGEFTTSGSGAPLAHIARWNGTSWQPMGGGLDGNVYSLQLAADGSLYAAGAFSNSGTSAVSKVARWNGSAWTPLGSGVAGNVYALCPSPDGSMFVGGSFSTAGGNPAVGVARWNGTSWSAVGTGVGGTVYALALDEQGTLYAGGSLSSTGGNLFGIAKYDGLWSQVGGGLYGGNVYALRFLPDGRLLAGGSFLSGADRDLHAVAVFDNGQWQAFGRSLAFDPSYDVIRSFQVLSDQRIIACGSLTTAAGRLARGMIIYEPDAPPAFELQPVDVLVCRGGQAQFHIRASGSGPFTYAWSRNGIAIDASSNPTAATPTLWLKSLRAADRASYTCRVTNACTSTTSSAAVVSICLADFNCDQAVDFFDYLDFVQAFASTAATADFNEDGVIDFFDYLDFLSEFSQGC